MDASIYQLATQEAVCLPWDGYSWLRISGNDRARFLHNLCTNDILKLQPGQACEAFFTNVQGKTIGFGVLFCEPDCLTVLTDAGQAENLLPRLDRYLIREDVELQAVDGEMRQLLVVGAQCPNILQEFDVADQDEPWSMLGENIRFQLKLYRVGPFRVPSILLHFPADMTDQVTQIASQSAVPLTDSSIVEVLRVENGFPRYGVDITETNLPQEVARDTTAISFNKGCYLGQETVARIDALGHVNKLLRRIALKGEQPPTPGAKLTRLDETVGHVTSVCRSPQQGVIGLAYLRRGHDQPGTVLESSTGEATVVG